MEDLLPTMMIYATFVASIKSIGTAVTLAGVGVYLHRRGFVEKEGKRTLAILSQQITFPLYLFTKILDCNQDWSDTPCPDVTSSLKDVWMLLYWPIYVVGAGIIVGWLVARLTKCPPNQVRAVIAACAFPNSTGLPITLIAVIHSNFPVTADLGLVDPSLFLSVYLLVYPALQWGLGGWLLAPTEHDEKAKVDNEQVEITSTIRNVRESIGHNVLNNTQAQEFYQLHRRGLSSTDEGLYLSEVNLYKLSKEQEEYENLTLSFDEAEGLSVSESQTGSTSCNDNFDHGVAQEEEKELSKLNKFPLRATQQRLASEEPGNLLDELCNGSNSDSQSFQSYGSKVTNGSRELRESMIKSSSSKRYSRTIESQNFNAETICQTIQHILERCLQPPVIGSILGIIAAVTPVRGYFVDIVNREGRAPLQWLFDGLHTVGETAVPINMMILGCNLSSSYKESFNSDKNETTLLPIGTAIGIVIGKMLVLPIIGILTTIVLKMYVWDIPDDIDGSFYLVILIVFLTPTANNVMVMVELSGSNANEGIARVIAMQYAIAPLILTLTMTIAVSVASYRP